MFMGIRDLAVYHSNAYIGANSWLAWVNITIFFAVTFVCEYKFRQMRSTEEPFELEKDLPVYSA
jgi:hypothetical protein